jgi:hypothetical protein
MSNPRRRISFSSIGLLPLVFVLLIGSPFLFIGFSEAFSIRQIVNNLKATRGVVVDNTWRAFASGGAAYCPVVEFRTNEGKAVRFTDGIGSYPPDYQINEEVNVLYDPNDVQVARISSWKRLWMVPTIFAVVGAMIILVGIGFICLSAISLSDE